MWLLWSLLTLLHDDNISSLGKCAIFLPEHWPGCRSFPILQMVVVEALVVPRWVGGIPLSALLMHEQPDMGSGGIIYQLQMYNDDPEAGQNSGGYILGGNYLPIFWTVSSGIWFRQLLGQCYTLDSWLCSEACLDLCYI